MAREEKSQRKQDKTGLSTPDSFDIKCRTQPA